MTSATSTTAFEGSVAPGPIPLRRNGAILGMVVAPWCWLVANFAYLLAIRDGGSDADGAGALALAAEHPTLTRITILAVMIGGILVVPAVAGLFRLAPTSRLVTVGGSMMVAGYVCYAGIAATGWTTLAMAEVVGPTQELAAVLDAAQRSPWAAWSFLVFVLGNLVGTLVLAVGLLRSRTVPRWAALAIASWPVLHVVGLVAFHNEVPQVIGAGAQAVGMAGCALALMRRQASTGPVGSPRSSAILGR